MGSGVEPASSYREVAGSIPLVGMLKCPWARYWTQNCLWCSGRHIARQPPPSVYECNKSLWTKASAKCPKCEYNVLICHTEFSSDAYKHQADASPDSRLFKHVLVMRSCPLEAEGSTESKGPKIQSALHEWSAPLQQFRWRPLLYPSVSDAFLIRKKQSPPLLVVKDPLRKIPLIFFVFCPSGPPHCSTNKDAFHFW